jgi:hypothetical protein
MSDGRSGICLTLGLGNEKCPSVEGNVLALKAERIKNGHMEEKNKGSRM